MNRSIKARFDNVVAQIGFVALGLIAPLACAAQVASTTIVRTGARDVLTRFEKNARTGRSGVPDVVRHPESYPRTTVDSVIAGLEMLAVSAEPELVRSEAAVALASAGSDDHPIPGVFEKKVQLYQRSNSNLVRGMIIAYIDSGQERTRAIDFLKATATSPAPPRFDAAPFLAAQHLSFMGAEGRAILTELYASGRLKDPHTFGFVKWFLSVPPQ